ncbi:MAG: FHA domain-containing protein [Verrucomicrobiota bacterium]
MAYTGIDILQSLGDSRASCNIVVSSRMHRVEFWIIDGILVHLEGCDKEDLEAFLLDKKPFIFLKPIELEPPKTLSIPLSKMVMEIASEHDVAVKTEDEEKHDNKHNEQGIFLRRSKKKDRNIFSPRNSLRKTRAFFVEQYLASAEKPRPVFFPKGVKTHILIGRSKRCDVACNDAKVSRIHCSISYEGKGTQFKVSDLGSSNGTYHNDSKITQVIARDHDIVRIGKTHFVLCLDEINTEPAPISNARNGIAPHPEDERDAAVKTSPIPHITTGKK